MSVDVMVFKMVEGINDDEQIATANQYLKKVGIQLQKDTRNGAYLLLTIDQDKYDRAVKRGAGKKTNIRGGKFTVGEVKTLIKQYGRDKVFEYIGVSRSTYERRLKKIKEECSGDMEKIMQTVIFNGNGRE